MQNKIRTPLSPGVWLFCFSNQNSRPFFFPVTLVFPQRCQAHSYFRVFPLSLPFTWDTVCPEHHMAYSLSSLRSPAYMTFSGRSSWTSGLQAPTSPTGYFLTTSLLLFPYSFTTTFLTSYNLGSHKTQERRGFACLHHSIPRAWHIGWHIVGIQEIFVEWVNN